MLSYVHPLFTVDQCQISLQSLRWKARPLHCPRCQSQDVDPWGNEHYRPGGKRSWWNGCKRTVNARTHTRMHQSQRPLPHWMLATCLRCLACSSRRIAREGGGHLRTSDRWCWGLRNAALAYDMPRQLAGTVEAEARYHTAGKKGQATHGGKKPGGAARGGAARSASRAGAMTIQIDWRSSPGSAGRPLSSSRRPGILPSSPCRRPRTSPSKRGVGSIRTRRAATGRCRATGMRSCITRRKNTRAGRGMRIAPSACFPCANPPCGCFVACAKPPCQGTSGSWSLRNARQHNAFEQAALIVPGALDPAIARRAKQGEFVTGFDHFALLQTAIN